MTASPAIRLGVDIGGTFTDVALEVGDKRYTAKGLTTSRAPEAGVLAILRAVIAEADGLVKYNDRKDLLAERERDHQLSQQGYTVVHFTWKELFQNTEDVPARIRAALAAGQAGQASQADHDS